VTRTTSTHEKRGRYGSSVFSALRRSALLRARGEKRGLIEEEAFLSGSEASVKRKQLVLEGL